MSAGLVTGLLSVLLPTNPLAPLPSHVPALISALSSALSSTQSAAVVTKARLIVSARSKRERKAS